MEFAIDAMKEEYIPGFWKAVDSVAREKKYLAFLQAPPLTSTQEFVEQNLKNNVPSFVALVEGQVVGWCDLIQIPRPIFSHVGELGMGVMAPFRGYGIGKALIEQVLQTSQERGYTRIELSVRAGNSVAIELYKKLRFEFEGVKRSHACVEGVYEDVLWMAKLF
jgi:ribosomal protein S18 acetylase RimI-like enzyme